MSYKSVKAHATMPNDVMGNVSFPLLRKVPSVSVLKIEGKDMYEHLWFLHPLLLDSANFDQAMVATTIITFNMVAYAFRSLGI